MYFLFFNSAFNVFYEYFYLVLQQQQAALFLCGFSLFSTFTAFTVVFYSVRCP